MSTSFPYELLVRITKQRKVAGALVRMLIVDDEGREREGELIPLADATDPLFIEFAEIFRAQALTEIEELTAANQVLEQQLDQPLISEISSPQPQLSEISYWPRKRSSRSTSMRWRKIISRCKSSSAPRWPTLKRCERSSMN